MHNEQHRAFIIVRGFFLSPWGTAKFQTYETWLFVPFVPHIMKSIYLYIRTTIHEFINNWFKVFMGPFKPLFQTVEAVESRTLGVVVGLLMAKGYLQYLIEDIPDFPVWCTLKQSSCHNQFVTDCWHFLWMKRLCKFDFCLLQCVSGKQVAVCMHSFWINMKPSFKSQ